MCFASATAQWIPTANLTVFSEDGAKFYLELNGERYNTEAQTNVRIEELPNPYYSCKIVFADPKIEALTKNNLMVADVDGKMQDVTYRIKTDKKGKKSLKFYSFVPAQQNMVRPANTCVYRYGTPNHMIVDANGRMTETVTVQQTTTTGNAYGMSVNAPGMSVNVNMPAGNAVTTTTTTTSTSTSYGTGDGGGRRDDRYDDRHGRGRDDRHDDRRRDDRCRYAMDDRDFKQAKTAIEETSFDDTRLSTAKQIVETNCLDANQVAALVKLMKFDDSQLDLAKYAYGYCIDPGNYFKVVNVLKFDSSKAELNEYIRQ